MTYVPTAQGWLYLACVTDVFGSLMIGWSMAPHRKSDLIVDAVTLAVHQQGGHLPGMIHHSDRGGEYTSHALECELRRHGALAGMGSVADYYDHPLADSLLATLESELFNHQPQARFVTHCRKRLAIFDYLETFYNPRLRHLTLGQLSSTAFARTLSALRPEPQPAATRCPSKRVNSSVLRCSTVELFHWQNWTPVDPRLDCARLRAFWSSNGPAS